MGLIMPRSARCTTPACTLRDPMTGERVLVAEADALRALLPDVSITLPRSADPAELLLRLENARPSASGAAFKLQMRRHTDRTPVVPAL